jgi:hypothetical protein
VDHVVFPLQDCFFKLASILHSLLAEGIDWYDQELFHGANIRPVRKKPEIFLAEECPRSLNSGLAWTSAGTPANADHRPIVSAMGHANRGFSAGSGELKAGHSGDDNETDTSDGNHTEH